MSKEEEQDMKNLINSPRAIVIEFEGGAYLQRLEPNTPLGDPLTTKERLIIHLHTLATQSNEVEMKEKYDIAVNHFQSANSIIIRIQSLFEEHIPSEELVDTLSGKLSQANDKIKELEGIIELKDIASGIIIEEYKTELKELREGIEEKLTARSLLMFQGYYNWIYLDKPSVDEILDKLEIERKQLLSNK